MIFYLFVFVVIRQIASLISTLALFPGESTEGVGNQGEKQPSYQE